MKKAIINISIKIIAFVAIIITFLILVNKDTNSQKPQEISSYIGITSYTINYDITDGKIFCDNDLNIQLKNIYNIEQQIVPYEFFGGIKNLKITANNHEIPISKIDLFMESGKLKIDFSQYPELAEAELIDLKINVKYECYKGIQKYQNTDVLCPIQRNMYSNYNFYFINNVNINVNSDFKMNNFSNNFLYTDSEKATENSYYIFIKDLKKALPIEDTAIFFDSNYICEERKWKKSSLYKLQ